MQRAFTFIEVMAVVLLLGLLAGAAAWSLADDARRTNRKGALQQVVQMERMTRLGAARLGDATRLQIDLDQGYMRRISVDATGKDQPGHTVDLGGGGGRGGVRLERMIVPNEAAWLQDEQGTRRATAVSSGSVDVAYSSKGHSQTFALRLAWPADDQAKAAQDEEALLTGDGVWIVFAGLTGQVTFLQDEDQVNNLFAMLETGRSDAR